jgi:voltage-gated potassium channel
METADRGLTDEHVATIIRVLDVAVASAAVATIPITLVELRGNSTPLIIACDWIVWVIFVAEYLVMLWLPPKEGGFGDRRADRRELRDWRNWVSIAIIVLSFPLLAPIFQFIRLVRVVRLARLGRIAAIATRGVGQTVGRRGVLYVAGLVIVAIVLGGALMTTVEPKIVGGTGTLSGIWWAAVTTVGTGIHGPGPETLEGRVIALLLMLCGVALLTTLAGSIAAFFLGKEVTVDAPRVQKQLDEIHEAVTKGTRDDSPPSWRA